MPSALVLKAMNGFHRGVLRVTRGRIGARIRTMAVLELTTTGRRSGQPHTVLLTSPIQHDTNPVIVASRGGAGRHPDWFLNLCAHPAVDVAFIGASTQTMRARVANAEERSLLWPRVVATYMGYATYQTRTDREIPLVLLEPSDHTRGVTPTRRDREPRR